MRTSRNILGALLFVAAMVPASSQAYQARENNGRQSSAVVDFAHFESLVLDGHGAEPKRLLESAFPSGSPTAELVSAATAAGAKCTPARDATGVDYQWCVKSLQPPLKESFLGAIEWTIYVGEKPRGTINNITVMRRASAA